MMIWQWAALATVVLGIAAAPHAGKPSFAPYRGGIFLLFSLTILTMLLADRLPTI